MSAPKSGVLITDTTTGRYQSVCHADGPKTSADCGPYDHAMPNVFSAEVAGGATFDVAYRFLGERIHGGG